MDQLPYYIFFYGPLVGFLIFSVAGVNLISNKIYKSGSIILLGALPSVLLQAKRRFFPTEYLIPIEDVNNNTIDIEYSVFDQMMVWAEPTGLVVVAMGVLFLIFKEIPYNKLL